MVVGGFCSGLGGNYVGLICMGAIGSQLPKEAIYEFFVVPFNFNPT